MARQRNRRRDYALQVDELITSSSDLEPGPAKIGVLEAAIRIADTHNDGELGFDTRLELIDAATFGGAPDVAMVAFAWCLARVDAEPDRFYIGNLLWKYKWILGSAPEFPTIKRDQIMDMLKDMERRYRAAGSGMHPVHQTARSVHQVMGDLDAARKAHAKVQKSAQTWLSDCPACELDNQVDFYLDTGRPALAFRKAKPIFAGRMTCGEVPHRTYSRLLVPLLFAGENERAADYHRKGTRLIRTNPNLLQYATDHVLYLTLIGDLAAAQKYLERHLPNGLTTTSPDVRFEFDRAATFTLECLAEQAKPRRVRLPANPGLPEGLDGTDPAALRENFAAEARALATAFDARNGNDRYTRRLAELANLKKRIKPSSN